ncbi:hypothetical protein QNO07_07195 [Streptomyces sp. 549]|uniref:hypothetical protein n=1 Tax=Streptomyces sp. 549 TaxID=3049076 RepID=UPI0024C3CA29|nr:hypothetical protein [Streptomyces sp. 549]MDK1473209.1 hypothetical protein [Streptomyces sp. 549]
MSQERQLYELRLGVYATHGQAKDLLERAERLLCPEPEHDGPCEIPWSSALHGPDEEIEETYEELVEQFRIESGEWAEGEA